MSLRLFLVFILSLGCSTQKAQRNVASEPTKPLQVIDPGKSMVQIFPAVADTEGVWYYFYLQLKNPDGHYIDSDDIIVKTAKGEKMSFETQRIKTGRYYLSFQKLPGVSSAQLNIYAQGKPLKEEFKLSFHVPHKRFSKVHLVKNSDHELTFELHLNDEKNGPIAMNDRPEILLDGKGNIVSLSEVKKGVWQFSITYPEENQILYLSVRAMGVLLPRIFRYQHVEK